MEIYFVINFVQELETTNFEKSKLETEIDILKRKLGKYEPTF